MSRDIWISLPQLELIWSEALYTHLVCMCGLIYHVGIDK